MSTHCRSCILYVEGSAQHVVSASSHGGAACSGWVTSWTCAELQGQAFDVKAVPPTHSPPNIPPPGSISVFCLLQLHISIPNACMVKLSRKCSISRVYVAHSHAGFGPQKLAVLAAYSLRQGLLVWLKTYKADVELRQNIDPTVGIRAPSIPGRSNTERAAAAAVADAQATGTLNPRATPYPQMDTMCETNSEGILDSVAAAQLASHQQQSGADPIDPFMHGANAAGMGRSQNGREPDAFLGVCSPSSRSLQGPNFSSKAFPSFSGSSSFDAPTPPPQQLPGSPFVSDSHAPDANVPHSNTNLSVGSPTSFPRPSRAPPPPPPPAALVPPSSPFISPFAQAAQSAVAAGFPPLDRLNSGGSVHSASSEREKRPTVRFADTPTINDIPPATISSRPYQHTNSGFTELAMSRAASPGPPPPTSQAAASQAPAHHRSRSDLGQGSRAGPRSVSWNRSMSRQERAASVTLDALELPPLPLPEEAVAGSGEAALSRQASRQMSLSTRQLSGFRYDGMPHAAVVPPFKVNPPARAVFVVWRVLVPAAPLPGLLRALHGLELRFISPGNSLKGIAYSSFCLACLGEWTAACKHGCLAFLIPWSCCTAIAAAEDLCPPSSKLTGLPHFAGAAAALLVGSPALAQSVGNPA